jgi:hypothetical protein
MARSFAHISTRGSVKYGQVLSAIGVLEALDKVMSIGAASCRTWDENGLAVWTIRIGKEEIPGRWVIVNRTSSQRDGSRLGPIRFVWSPLSGSRFARHESKWEAD